MQTAQDSMVTTKTTVDTVYSLQSIVPEVKKGNQIQQHRGHV